ncbi:MAG: hypothetical protein ACREKS_20725 [Candidatus Rokuibacteriota bacterium]
MTVTVVMHGNLRRFMPGGANRASLDVPKGTTVEGLLACLGAEQDTWLVARNQVVAERGMVLQPAERRRGLLRAGGGRLTRSRGGTHRLLVRRDSRLKEQSMRTRIGRRRQFLAAEEAGVVALP